MKYKVGQRLIHRDPPLLVLEVISTVPHIMCKVVIDVQHNDRTVGDSSKWSESTLNQWYHLDEISNVKKILENYSNCL